MMSGISLTVFHGVFKYREVMSRFSLTVEAEGFIILILFVMECRYGVQFLCSDIQNEKYNPVVANEE